MIAAHETRPAPDAVAAARAGVIEEFTSRVIAMRAYLALLQDGTAQDCYIVRNAQGNAHMHYDYESGEYCNPRVIHILTATRFRHKAEAQELAFQTRNGAGVRANAVLLSRALQDEIEKVQGLIDALKVAGAQYA